MSALRFQHKQFYKASEQLEAMRWLKKTIKDEDFDGIAFALAQPYSRWGYKIISLTHIKALKRSIGNILDKKQILD